ncbi:hypothetical protein [Nitrosospira briensis]|uniref:hypothetical protein n=1 Tax=Nitrosospira briensis TaxID=35799 RepID=UPI00046B009C|nr:hypothetical protein [Nitrosospira briensis]
MSMQRFLAFRILPVIALSIFIVIGAPVAAQTVSKKTDEATQQASDEARKKIRKANDFKLKTGELLFPKQAESLAKGYKETAEIIARQGGDPKPILDAAAYFEGQSELVSRVNASNKPSVR